MSVNNARFEENSINWNDVLQYMAEENSSLKARVGKVLESGNEHLCTGLQHYRGRFRSQDEIITMLRSQLKELDEKYGQAKMNNIQLPAEFDEQMKSFKIDIDRVALLFSRLKAQFNRYVIENLK